MLVQACASANFDTASQTCINPVWVDYPTVIPPLSVSDGLIVSSAIISLYALAWSFKFLRRYISPRTG